MKFFKCAYCGERKERSFERSLSRVVGQRITLLAGLLAFFNGNVENLHSLYAATNKKSVCHSHYAGVGAALTHELRIRGVTIRTEEPKQGQAEKLYVSADDIPDQLMNYLFMCERKVTKMESRMTRRDVTVFLYDSFERYFDNNQWAHAPIETFTWEESLIQEAEEGDSHVFKRPRLEEDRTSEPDTPSKIASSSDRLTTASVHTPPADTSGSTFDSVQEAELNETNPALLRTHFLVEGEQLLQLFKFCPQCGCSLPKKNGVCLKASGTAPVVQYHCRDCSIRGSTRWEGQKRAVSHSREKTFKGNIIAAVSAITTGLRFIELQRWAEQSQIAMFSKTTFWRVFQWSKAAVETVYARHQTLITDHVRSLNEDGALDLAADGSYDSRGFSALIGKVVLADLRSKLVLDIEVMHRSETGIFNHYYISSTTVRFSLRGVSGRMEVVGTRRLLRRVVQNGFKVRSLTTDRSYALSALVGELQAEIGPLTHYFDGWHLVKWLGNELRKASKSRGCEELGVWIEKVKTHLWKSIAYGAEHGGTRHMFNTCLHHVKGVHDWTPAEETGPYVGCAHAALDGPRPFELVEGSRSFIKLEGAVMSRRFQKDLDKASPHGGTSICESKNALDRMYCRKEIYYPISTYPLYAKLSTMHFNTLRLAELSGERRVQRTVTVRRKYLTRTSAINIMSPVRHAWRDEILEEVLCYRIAFLKSRRAEADSEDLPLSEEVMGDVCSEEAYGGMLELHADLQMDPLDESTYDEVGTALRVAYSMVGV